MRVCICDYSGHPFQVELSRELASRSHEVLHLHLLEFQTPKGRLALSPEDPATLAIEAVSLGRPFAKYGFIKRRFQEIEIGRKIGDRIRAYAPDAVIGCNLPIDALSAVVNSCAKTNRPFIFWQQDIYSRAIRNILGRRYGVAGRLIGKYYQYLEGRAAAQSAKIIVIASDFFEILNKEFSIPASKITTIENWAPLKEITPCPKVNAWSLAQGLANFDVVLYTGTLGMKHDPTKLLAVAETLRERPKTRIVVTSEGPSASWLSDRAKMLRLETLKVLPFQPYESYPEVLSTADVLIAVLEADAGKFSVPSKILSYLCAGRAIVLSAPFENLASKIIQRSQAGIVVPPHDTKAFIRAATTLLDDSQSRTKFAANARAYAQCAFDIHSIGSQFEAILASAAAVAG